MKGFTVRRLTSLMCAAGILTISSHALASGYQIWEQDIASIGNFHAGYAATANDASTAFYNPAGIPRIKNQQAMMGAAFVASDFKYTGSISVNTLNAGDPVNVTNQGGASAVIPNIHYVAPITEDLGFGFSIDVPFGSKVEYGRTSALQYASVRAETSIVDISPSLGYRIVDQFYIGGGFDVQQMTAQFDQTGILGPGTDTSSRNHFDDTGYGYHLGLLYVPSEQTRIGLSYHSRVGHHLTGTSKFVGPLDGYNNDLPILSYNATVNMAAPAYTAISIYEQPWKQWGFMGSLIYTQWGTINAFTLNNLAGIQNFDASTSVQVVVPQYFRNTWNLSLGANYYITDRATVRFGIGYDETPTTNTYRNVQMPDNNRYALALGGRYQAGKRVALDVGWTHIFMKNADINPPPQSTGDQVVTTAQVGKNGSSNGGGDVFGLGLLWDIA